MYYYLLMLNDNEDDVTLTKFRTRTEALRYLEDMGIVTFVLTNIIEQSGMVFGFPIDDYELITE